MDGVVLVIVGKATKQKVNILRIVLGAAIGALGACVIVVVQRVPIMIRFLFIYIMVCGLMSYVAFNYQGMRKLLLTMIYLYIVTIFLGGVVSAIFNSEILEQLNFMHTNSNGIGVKGLLLVMGIICITIPTALRFMNGLRDRLHTVYDVTLVLEHKSVTVNGFYDTGNQLREPLSKRPVIIAEKQVMEQIMDKELMEYETRVKIIPYRSIGQASGSMYGIVVDQMEIKVDNQLKQHRDVIVGIYEGQLSSKREYQVILHSDLL